MRSVVILSMDNLYYGNTAAVVRMNQYAKALALAGVNVYLASAYLLASKQDWVEVEPHIFTLPYDRITLGKGYNLFYVMGVVGELKSRLASIQGEIVVLNYPNTSSLLLDILLLRCFKKKLPIWCEVNEVRKYSSSSGKTFRGRLYSLALEKTYKHYRGLFFISRNIQEYYALKARKSVVVPILSECDHPLMYSRGLDSLDIVFVGTISFPKENLEELFEGFLMFCKTHPEARLHLYGPITLSNKKKLDNYVDRTKMQDAIQYHGMIPHNQVREVLSSAGAFVLPRKNNKQNYYGFSTKLSEYAVSGAPIILTDTGVVADYFKDGNNCLMCEGYDRESFRKKFEALARMSRKEKQQMVMNAYAVAKKWFDCRLYSNRLAKALFEE